MLQILGKRHSDHGRNFCAARRSHAVGLQIALQCQSNRRNLIRGDGRTILDGELCRSRSGNRGDLLRQLIRRVVPANGSTRRDEEDQNKYQQKWPSMRDHWLPRIITCDSHLDLHLGPHGESGLAAPRSPASASQCE